MNETDIKSLIAAGETLTVEFKGEEREAFNDRALYENVVCLANGEGGTLLIGVEDNGHVTGARPRHGATTDHAKLQAAIFNNTELCDLNGPQATRLLKKMVKSGKLVREGPPRRWSTYHLPPNS